MAEIKILNNDIVSVSTGKLGIGTTSPGNKFHIKDGASGFAGTFDARNKSIVESSGEAYYSTYVPDNSFSGIRFFNSSGLRGFIDYYHGTQGDALVYSAANHHKWLTNGVERLRIIQNGNVGIGTTSPSSKLHVSDATNISMGSGGEGQFRVEGSGYTGAIALDGTAMYIYHNSASRNLVLGTNETAAITIHQSNQTLTFNAYGAGYLKTDASGNVTVDTSTIEDTLDSVTDRGATTTNDIEVGNITTKNDSGIYSFSDTVDASASEDIFSISNQHGAQAFRVTFVCSTSGYSVAKTYEVVHAHATDPVFFKVVDTGAFGNHDFDASFRTQAGGGTANNNTIICEITNSSTTINADIATTVFLGGSPTAITVTAL